MRIRFIFLVAALVALVALPSAALGNANPQIREAAPFFSQDMPFNFNVLDPNTEIPEAAAFVCALPKSNNDVRDGNATAEQLARARSLGVAGKMVPQEHVDTFRQALELQIKVLSVTKDNKELSRLVSAAIAAGDLDKYKESLEMVGRLAGVSVDVKVNDKDKEVLAKVAASKEIQAMLNPAAEKADDTSKFIPTGCPWRLRASGNIDMPGIGGLIKDPVGFMMEMSLHIATFPAQWLYDTTAPLAWRYSFFTPHAERGETLFNVVGQDGEMARYGFDQALAASPQQQMEKAGWLHIATWVRAFTSGLYIVILVFAGLLFMLRGGSKTKLDALRLAPMIAVSALTVLLAPSLIGWAITTGNILIGDIFQMKDMCSAAGGRCANTIQHVSAIITNEPVDEGLSGRTQKAFAVTVSALAFAGLAVIALVRQLLMIGLVVLTPVACFLMILPRYRSVFVAWATAIGYVIVIPLVLALTLRIGLMINPLGPEVVTNTGRFPNESNAEVVLGLVMMLVTLMVMAWIPWKMFKQIRGSRVGRGLRGSLTSMAAGGAMGPHAALAGNVMNLRQSARAATQAQGSGIAAGGAVGPSAAPLTGLAGLGQRMLQVGAARRAAASDAQEPAANTRVGVADAGAATPGSATANAVPSSGTGSAPTSPTHRGTPAAAPGAGPTPGQRISLSGRDAERLLDAQRQARAEAAQNGTPQPANEWEATRFNDDGSIELVYGGDVDIPDVAGDDPQVDGAGNQSIVITANPGPATRASGSALVAGLGTAAGSDDADRNDDDDIGPPMDGAMLSRESAPLIPGGPAMDRSAADATDDDGPNDNAAGHTHLSAGTAAADHIDDRPGVDTAVGERDLMPMSSEPSDGPHLEGPDWAALAPPETPAVDIDDLFAETPDSSLSERIATAVSNGMSSAAVSTAHPESASFAGVNSTDDAVAGMQEAMVEHVNAVNAGFASLESSLAGSDNASLQAMLDNGQQASQAHATLARNIRDLGEAMRDGNANQAELIERIRESQRDADNLHENLTETMGEGMKLVEEVLPQSISGSVGASIGRMQSGVYGMQQELRKLSSQLEPTPAARLGRRQTRKPGGPSVGQPPPSD